jgi:hypothetical protein
MDAAAVECPMRVERMSPPRSLKAYHPAPVEARGYTLSAGIPRRHRPPIAPISPVGDTRLMEGTQLDRRSAAGSGAKNFRFYDNRQKYLMFVNTCSEKRVIAERVMHMLATLQPRPPALRFFDAGVGDGSVLTRVLRSMHQRFPRFPLYIGAKEISLEDIRLTLEKMPDRFFEHPEMVLALTNLPYADAPWLAPAAAWHEVALTGTTSAEFEQQIVALQPFLDANWRTRVDPQTGRLLPETPAVLVLYRQDCRFLLDQVIPRQGEAVADFDLVLASQPYRLRAETGFKARSR